MAEKRILVLGGGTGGYVASTYLVDKAREHGLDVEVTLITDSEWFYMPPLWMDVAVEGLPLDETRAPIRNLSKYGVNVIVDPVASIDLAERKVSTESGAEYSYDYLVIALGIRNAWERYPGLAEEGYHNYDPEAAQRLHEALKSFKGGRVVIAVPETPYRCGIYPMEMATVLGSYFEKKGVKAEITLLLPKLPNGATPIEALGPDIANLWRTYLDRYNVKVYAHSAFDRVEGRRKVVVTKEAEFDYDLLIKVPPPGLPKPLDNPDLKWSQDERFTTATAPHFRHPKYSEVFLVGDHAMPAAGLALAGVFIHNAALVAAKAILGDMAGIDSPAHSAHVTCAAYVADAGWLGTCEVTYDTSAGMYRWAPNCYVNLVSPIVRMIKRGFYTGWLSRLRFPG